MKPIQLKRTLPALLACVLTFLNSAKAQVCDDPANVIHGLTLTGIHPVTVSTGAVAAQINPAYSGNPAANSNGLGYSPFNGKFYFFKRSPSATPQEFVSFDPASNSLDILAACPTTYSVYVGCVTPDGTGYYCWDNQARLFYYDILANTWTLITSTIVDQFGNDVDAIFRTHGSGDLAADGLGRLLMLPSSNTRYALYRMNAPLPTTPVASIVVTELVPLTVPPAKFVGIAMNSTGQILMNTAAPTNRIYRLEDNFSLTLISTLTQDINDFTSCNFPFAVLPISFKSFTTVQTKYSVRLQWEISENAAGTFAIEHSTDGNTWKQIGTSTSGSTGSFEHKVNTGIHHYRIRIDALNGTSIYSIIRSTQQSASVITVWPNPTQDRIWVSGHSGGVLQLLDISGKVLHQSKLSDANSLYVGHLRPGVYMARLLAEGRIEILKFQKK